VLGISCISCLCLDLLFFHEMQVDPCPSPGAHPRCLFPDGGDDWHTMTADLMHDPVVVALLMSLLGTLRSVFHTRAELALENLALRQQLANLRHTSGRPRIHMAGRAFWLVLSRLWSRWADVLVIVKPDTIVRWHRTGFRLFWRWKSRSGKPVQNDVSPELKALIQQMAEANVGWGAPRIHGELLNKSSRHFQRTQRPST